MSRLKLVNLDPTDSEFIAEESLITIISGINHPALRFISGIFGPLEAGLPCVLPLWLAITLRKKGKCTISLPQWLSVENLEKSISNERDENLLEPLPFHYVEIAYLLLNHAKEDIPNPDKISALLRDLESIRIDRLKIAIQSLTERVKGGQKVTVAKVANISSMEIFSIKDFVIESLDQFRLLTTVSDSIARSNEASIDPITFRQSSATRLDNLDSDESVNATRLRKFRR